MKRFSTLVLALVGLLCTMPAMADCYLIGEFNDLYWETNVGVKLDSIAPGIYSGKVSATRNNVYFSVATQLTENAGEWDKFNNEYRYGAFSDGELLPVSGMETAMQKGGYAWVVYQAGEYTVTVNFNTNTISCLKEGIEPVTECYIVGDVNGWDLNTPVAMTQVEENVFSITTEFSGYFMVMTKKCTDWMEVVNYRYGPATNDEMLVVNGPNKADCFAQVETTWQVQDWGNYTFTIDFNKMQVSLVGEYDGSYFYFVNSEKNMKPYPSNQLQKTAEGVYTLKNVSFSESAVRFAVYDAKNDVWYGSTDHEAWMQEVSLNTPIALAEGYSLMYLNSPCQLSEVTFNALDKTLYLAGEYMPEVSDLYIRGEVNFWEAPLDWSLASEGDGVYTFDLTDKGLTGEFKLASSNWSNYNFGGDGTPVIPGVEYRLYNGASNLALSDETDLTKMTLRIVSYDEAYLLVESKVTSIEHSAALATDVRVNGRTIILEHDAAVLYDIAGHRLVQGKSALAVSSGIYLVNVQGKTQKIIVK